MVTAVALVGSIALAAGGFYVVTNGGKKELENLGGPVARIVPAPAESPAPAAESAPAQPESAAAPVTTAEAAPTPPSEADPARPKRGELVEVKKAAELFTNRTGTFLKAGTAQHLEVGMTIDVVGPKRKRLGDLRVLAGTATVLEVWPKLARVALDPDAASARNARFGSLPAGPRVRPPTRTPVASPAPVEAKPTESKVATAEAKSGAAEAKPAAASAVKPAGVEASPVSTQPVVAKVETEQPKPVAAAAPAPAPAAPLTPKPLKLNGRTVVAGGKLTLYNTDSYLWTDCTMAIPGRKSLSFNGLGQGGRREFQLGAFRVDAHAREMPANQVEVKCAEGRNDFAARF
jgi:hypothetical protein